jgi:hypothetical protein
MGVHDAPEYASRVENNIMCTVFAELGCDMKKIIVILMLMYSNYGG